MTFRQYEAGKHTTDYRDAQNYHRPNLTWPGRVEQTFGVQTLQSLNQIVNEGNILEIGTAAGFTTQELVDIFGSNVNVFGIDVEDFSGERMHERKNMYQDLGKQKAHSFPKVDKYPTFIQADGYFPPFADNSFKVVFNMNNLYQVIEGFKLSPDELKTTIAKILDILKPHGFFCLSGSWAGILPYIIFQLDEHKKVKIFAEQSFSDYVTDDKIGPEEIFLRLKNILSELGVLI